MPEKEKRIAEDRDRYEELASRLMSMSRNAAAVASAAACNSSLHFESLPLKRILSAGRISSDCLVLFNCRR